MSRQIRKNPAPASSVKEVREQCSKTRQMSGPVRKILPEAPARPKVRAAAYCRVSTDLDCQATSIVNQRDHYIAQILAHPGWELADIYMERGVSGTRAENRPELNRMLDDCRAGRIHVVMTKSISRFARNTTECIEMVRLIFEKEQIDTASMESEFLLTVLSAFAADESRSISVNMKWSIRRRFEEGTHRISKAPYGYVKTEEGFAIHPAESQVIRRVFDAILSGHGFEKIARELNRDGIPTWTEARRQGDGDRHGFDENTRPAKRWTAVTVRTIVRNPFYTGDCLFQKTYIDEEYRQHINCGQLDQYLAEDDYPAIIDRETFRKAQEAVRRRAARGQGRSA